MFYLLVSEAVNVLLLPGLLGYWRMSGTEARFDPQTELEKQLGSPLHHLAWLGL